MTRNDTVNFNGNDKIKGGQVMICFYHSADLDGHCSGAIVKKAYPDCELIGINYGDEFPWDKAKNENVIMVDFSLQPFEDMIRLNQEAASFIWLDHHISAIKEAKEHSFECMGILDTKRAGCELTWNFYFSTHTWPDTVRLLGRYDVWDHSDERTLPFQHGMKSRSTRPEENMDLWEEWFKSFPTEILEEGEVIHNYVNQDNEKYASLFAFETELDGLKCIAINRMMTNSQMFDSVWDEEKYDAMMTFGFKKNCWTVSLYSTKEDIDVSEIAKARDGGGHKGAAGFQCEELPFDLK